MSSARAHTHTRRHAQTQTHKHTHGRVYDDDECKVRKLMIISDVKKASGIYGNKVQMSSMKMFVVFLS